jgi:hypothetical protein
MTRCAALPSRRVDAAGYCTGEHSEETQEFGKMYIAHHQSPRAVERAAARSTGEPA